MAGIVLPQAQPQDPADPQAGSSRSAAFDPFYAEQAETSQQQALAQQIRAAALQQIGRAGQQQVAQTAGGAVSSAPGLGAGLAGVSGNMLGLGMENRAIKRQAALNQQRFEMMDKDIQDGMDLLGKPLTLKPEIMGDMHTVDENAVAENNVTHKQWQQQLLRHAGHMMSFYGDLPGAKEAANLFGAVGSKDNTLTKVNENTVIQTRSGQPGSVALKANSPLVMTPNQTVIPERTSGLNPAEAITAPSGPMQVQPGTSVYGGTGLQAPGQAAQGQPASATAPSQPGDVASATGMPVLRQGVPERIPHPLLPGVLTDAHDVGNPAKYTNAVTGESLATRSPADLNRMVSQTNSAAAAKAINDDKMNFVNIAQNSRQALASMHALGTDRVADIALLREFDRVVNAPLARVPMMTHGEQEALDTVRDRFSNMLSKFLSSSGAMSETTREQFVKTARQLTAAASSEANAEIRTAVRSKSIGLPEHAANEADVRAMIPGAGPLRASEITPVEGSTAPTHQPAAVKPAPNIPAVDPAAQWKHPPRAK